MIKRSKEVDTDFKTVLTGSIRPPAGRITLAINPQRRLWNAETWTLGTRLFYLFSVEKLTIEKEFFFLFLPHFLGAQIVFGLRGRLAIGQADNHANPALVMNACCGEQKRNERLKLALHWTISQRVLVVQRCARAGDDATPLTVKQQRNNPRL
ncbi:hypothetical protein AVEN_187647-1 [Araneus ventricosus]|uniref:Uncharacterized protein n=1 Tax=Araneus ventricosus TaxID=182803 RepID=A0A4Y2VCI0_ARAVE|nr:hypothetical protein AVEN_187647-1 [Araneus ventricosus]